MFKNFMTFNLSTFVIKGNDLIWSRVMVLNFVCKTDNSRKTSGRLALEGNTSPRFERMTRQLLLASLNFDEDANSLTSKLDAFKLSSNVLALDKISFKHIGMLEMSPLMQLIDADISKRSKLRKYCSSQWLVWRSCIPVSMYDRAEIPEKHKSCVTCASSQAKHDISKD